MAYPTIVGTGIALESQTGGQPNMPAHQAGDDLFLWVETSNSDTVTFSANVAGFTLMPDSGVGTGGSAGANGECKLSVFHKKATDGATVAPTIADTGNHQVAQIFVARGCDATTPHVGHTSSIEPTATTAITMPGSVTTRAESLVIQMVGHGRDNAGEQVSGFTNAALANITQITDQSLLSGHGGGCAVISGEKAVAGSFGGTTATLLGTSMQERYTFVLQPPLVSSAWPMNPATVCYVSPAISWGPLSPGASGNVRRKRRMAAILGGNLAGSGE
jgi:hypothetical protein